MEARKKGKERERKKKEKEMFAQKQTKRAIFKVVNIRNMN